MAEHRANYTEADEEEGNGSLQTGEAVQTHAAGWLLPRVNTRSIYENRNILIKLKNKTKKYIKKKISRYKQSVQHENHYAWHDLFAIIW